MNDKKDYSKNEKDKADLRSEFIRLKGTLIPSFAFSIDNYLDSSYPRDMYEHLKKDIAAFIIVGLSSRFEKISSFDFSKPESVSEFLKDIRNGKFGQELIPHTRYIEFVMNYSFPRPREWKYYFKEFIERSEMVLDMLRQSILNLGDITIVSNLPKDKKSLTGKEDTDLNLIRESEFLIEVALESLEDL